MTPKKPVSLKVYALFFTILTSLLLTGFGLLSLPKEERIDDTSKPIRFEDSGLDDDSVLDFWNKEINRVNEVDLNLEYGEIKTIKHGEHEYLKKEIYFDSPNWVDAEPAVLRLHGYLIFPENVQSINPGCLCLHGLNGRAEDMFDLAYPYLEKGFIVLAYDHPGHGLSEGESPSNDNFYFQNDYNKSAQFYLTACGAIQGLRILEQYSLVDNSKIMVTGGSYGALNCMYLAGICGGERIAGITPLGAVGDLEETAKDPSKLIFWVLGKQPEELSESFVNEKLRFFDVKNYLESAKLPPIMLMLGTNDEFFNIHSVIRTYDAIEQESKFLRIYPNGHHGLGEHEKSTKFFIDYIVNDGPAPPSIDVYKHDIISTLIGDTIDFEVKITSEEEIESVQLFYRHDIVGSTWEAIELKKSDNYAWSGSLHPGLISSGVDYYVVVNLEGGENLWFSSNLISSDQLVSNLTLISLIIIVAYVAIPSVFLIWRRYKKDVESVDEPIKLRAKKMLIIELSAIIIIESLFYISLILPWIILTSGNLNWTHIYIFNNIFTWKRYFGVVSIYLTIGFIIGWIIYTHLSIMKPMLAGFIKIGYPIFVLFVFTWYIGRLTSPNTSSSAQVFGTGHPGSGLILMLSCSIALMILGAWKRYYQTKLGIREAKTRWYNIDRWLKIRSDSKDPSIEVKN